MLEEGENTIDDVDHEGLHFLVAEPGDFGPRNLAIGGHNPDIGVVACRAARRGTAVQILQKRVSEADLGEHLGSLGIVQFFVHRDNSF